MDCTDLIKIAQKKLEEMKGIYRSNVTAASAPKTYQYVILEHEEGEYLLLFDGFNFERMFNVKTETVQCSKCDGKRKIEIECPSCKGKGFVKWRVEER